MCIIGNGVRTFPKEERMAVGPPTFKIDQKIDAAFSSVALASSIHRKDIHDKKRFCFAAKT